jgi:hypothetical protein
MRIHHELMSSEDVVAAQDLNLKLYNRLRQFEIDSKSKHDLDPEEFDCYHYEFCHFQISKALEYNALLIQRYYSSTINKC